MENKCLRYREIVYLAIVYLLQMVHIEFKENLDQFFLFGITNPWDIIIEHLVNRSKAHVSVHRQQVPQQNLHEE